MGILKKRSLPGKKLEYFKIIYPEDVPKLLEKIKIKDNKNASLRFRRVKKKGNIINIENYICRIKYKDKYAFLSSYVPLERNLNGELVLKKNIFILELESPQNNEYFIRRIIKHLKIEGYKIKKVIKIVN